MHRLRAFFLLGTLSLLTACDMESEKARAPAQPVTSATATAPLAPGTVQPSPAVVTEYTGTSPATRHSRCSIDLINGRPGTDFDTDKSNSATFEGWATNATGLMPANAIRILLIGTKSYAIGGSTGLERPDVAAAVGKAAATSGFRVAVPVLQIPQGTYSTRIEGADGSFSCDTRARLVVN